MLIQTEYGEFWLTQDPDWARAHREQAVIGVTGSHPEYELWEGVPFLTESAEALDDAYLRLVWCRTHQKPWVVAQNERWCLREMTVEDAAGLKALYEDPELAKYLQIPIGGLPRPLSAWRDWISAYCQYVYAANGPAIWVITNQEGEILGRAGLEPEPAAKQSEELEWYCCVQEPGRKQNRWGRAAEESLQELRENCWYLGYAVRRKDRGTGAADWACQQILQYAREQEIPWLAVRIREDNQPSQRLARRLGFFP